MAFENGHNPEQESVDPALKEQQNQAQIDKEFDAVLKEYQNMPPQEQAEFIEAIANKDPHFNELYTQLKDYFWNNIKGLDEHLEALEIQKLFEAETEKTQELLQSQNSYFESHFSIFQDTLKETQINGVSVSVLTGKVYEGYIRYKDNPEPLIKALAGSELQQAQKALDNSLHAISTRIQAAPENMPEARLYAFKQHGEKESEILSNYEKIAEKFMHLMNSDAGKMILSNTAFSSFETGLKSNISEQLGYDRQTENEITQSIENSTKELLLNLGVIKKDLIKKLKIFYKINND